MLTPKFKIGDSVICVRVGWGETKVTCPDCLGQKAWKVTTPAGETFDTPCNTCHAGIWEGSGGKVSEWADRVTKGRLTIGSVRMDTADTERPISYMCRETGVGSGSVYDEQQLFSTDEEADAYGAKELARVKGARQAEELRQREQKKRKRIYSGKKAVRS